jgi:REP element-mobilizing transposase RayT
VFGDVAEDAVVLSPIGAIAHRCWEEIPNHFHGIVVITGRDLIKCRDVHGSTALTMRLNVPTRLSPQRGTLSVIIRTCKAAVTTECCKNGFPDFQWQSRFYDHIILDGKDLDRIREYIANNPINWYLDERNPRRPVA